MQKARKPAKKKSRVGVNMKKKQPKVRIHTKKHLLLCFVAVALIGLAGSYLLFSSFAASSYCASAQDHGTTPYTDPQPGKSYTTKFYVMGMKCSGHYYNDPELPTTVKWTVSISATNGGAPYEAISNISPASGQYVIQPFPYEGPPSDVSREIYINYTTTNDCGGRIKITVSLYGKNGNKLAEGTGYGGPPYGPGCPGVEEPGDPPPDPDPNTDPGEDPGDGPQGPGDGPQGPGKDPNNGPGAGGGGSSATTQGGKSTLPNSSNQGSKKQNKIEPSPFYDGKQYAPGSDAIDKAFGNISVAGRSIAHGWLYLAAITVTVAGVASYYWGWRQDSPIRKLIKR